MSTETGSITDPRVARRAWVMLIVLTILTVIGMTNVMPVLPFIVQQYLPADDPSLALWVGVLEGVNALCAFLAAPFLGGLSDRIGRRPVIVIAAFGAVAGYVVFGIGGALWVLLLGRIIQGVTAGDMPALFAYVADITPPKDRAKRFGLLGALTGIGMMIGPAMGGLLAAIDIRLPVAVTALCSLIIAICTIFFVPESLKPEHRATELKLTDLHPVKVLGDAFKRPILRGILIVIILLGIPFSFFANNFSVLAIDSVGWNATEVGFAVAAIGVLDIAIQGGLLALLLPRIGERAVVLSGIIGQGVGIGLLALVASLVHQPWLMIVGLLLVAGSQGLTQAPLDGLAANSVGDDEQGQTAGAVQAVNQGIGMFAPIVAGLLYSGVAHAAPYLLGVVLVIAAAVVFARAKLPAPRPDEAAEVAAQAAAGGSAESAEPSIVAVAE